jgi:hypothetical protein
MTAVSQATDGLFCDTAPLIVSNGQVWDGLFCLDGEFEIPLPRGGGGSVGHGPEFRPSPRPPVDKNEPIFLAQALQEDEELVLMLKAFVEVTQWH